ncbi:hypothetical protein [Allochromatium palmeri]|uniref:TIGR04219 family outer membrane beta-barrel protein n=1 Tax=Allochromatium palmeri TaxID=231048 RepID=A0A6N8E5W9_9GAMM|nr:hypothetical protein [Allochromatium palmeri]MTW19592.1 hypothetical protein [Allochromatium palmeri]
MLVPAPLRRMFAALAAISLSASPAIVSAADQVDPYDGNWHFTLTPYLWLPNINGTIDGHVLGSDLGDFRTSTEIGPNDYLQNLKFGVMATGEVRKGDWSVLTDIIYIDFGDQRSHVRNITGREGQSLSRIDRNADTSLSATVWTLAGARTLVRNPMGNLDLLAGFRYVGVDTKLKLNIQGSDGFLDASVNRSRNLTEWDGIIGVKGMIRLGEDGWYIPYYLDVGTGSSNLTWQSLLGLGYAFNWGDVNLSIRSLSYDFNDKDDVDLRMTGPALGATFRW